jgi:membrane fusion protein (multidrug efflux system)
MVGDIVKVFPIIMVTALIACGGGEEQGGFGGGGGPPPAPVETVVATTDTVVEAILATGTIEAVQSIELRPEVQGRLQSILVREGAEVAAGTPLFKVDDAELSALVAQLTAERDRAAQALQRTKELIAQNASSEADLEEAEANFRSREAQLDLQRVRLERTVVRAPFGGVVGERFVSVGDYVTSATSLTTLQTVDPQRAAFDVPERYAERLARGQEVQFTVAAVDRQFTGTVDFVDPVVQTPARTILVKARVRNRDRLLKPGMFVDVRLSTEVRGDAVVIPEDAVLPLEGGDFVWVVADGVATRRAVELGVRTPGFVEIRSGVIAGEQVVVGGLQRLFEGTPVMATEVER